MVNREIGFGEYLPLLDRSGLYPTIDAGIFIPNENTFTAPVRTATRYIDVGAQCDDRWNGKLVAHSADELATFFDDDCFASEDEVHRTGYAHDR